MDDAFYGIGKPGFLQSLKAAIDKVTPEQVNAAIKKHLQDDNMYLVIITADAAGMKRSSSAAQPTSITYAGERPAALLAEDKTIAALPIKVREADITHSADRQGLSVRLHATSSHSDLRHDRDCDSAAARAGDRVDPAGGHEGGPDIPRLRRDGRAAD